MDKEVITQEEIKAAIETVTSSEESIEDQIPSKVEYKLHKLLQVESMSAVERLCGHLHESTKYLRLEKHVRYTWKGND